MLEHQELLKLLDYDKETGIFTRKVRTTNSVKVGDIAGNKNSAGYLVVSVKGKQYLGHRLAWFYINSEWPEEIDHIDGDRFNNKIQNLRNCDSTENKRNSCISKNNKSGFTGVSWSKTNDKWRAVIWDKRKKVHLGYFKDINDAMRARLQAELDLGYHANHGRLAQC